MRVGDDDNGPGLEPVLSVVLMAYNEEASVAATCEEILAELRQLSIAYELVVVNDGSTDHTPAIVNDLAERFPAVRVVHHAVNAGLGGVYRTGFLAARGELVTFFPADGQFPATIIPEFVDAAREADLVLGYVPQRTDAVAGRLLSVIQRLVYRLLLGQIPRFQGIMMYRRALMHRIRLTSTGRDWVVLMEFIIRASRSGARIVSRSTEVRPRQFGASKVNNWRTIRSTLVHMARLRRALRNQA